MQGLELGRGPSWIGGWREGLNCEDLGLHGASLAGGARGRREGGGEPQGHDLSVAVATPPPSWDSVPCSSAHRPLGASALRPPARLAHWP